MTTTFEKYSNWYRNYSSRPTKDVEIIEAQHYCGARDFIPYPENEQSPGHRGYDGEYCGKPVVLIPGEKPWDFSKWEHADGSKPEHHYVQAAITCSFCGNNERGTVRYRQMSYSDETHCDRCGGISGYGIGD